MSAIGVVAAVVAFTYFAAWVTVSVIFPYSFLRIFAPMDWLFRD